MNSDRLLPNLLELINIRKSDKYVALSNLNIYYILKNIRKSRKTKDLKYQLRRVMMILNI